MSEETVAVTLITQNTHKFFSGTLPIEVVAETCSVNPRSEDLEHGFQRNLDENRAEQIAAYIRDGGTIPSSIILSAQSSAMLSYNSKNKTISFQKIERAFLILDGQHRVFGFKKLMNDNLKYRVPVIIYNELSPVDEARLFIDINTLQKPVPKELLLDIKKLADRENQEEILLDALFTEFENKPHSYLYNKLARIERQKSKISKVTFYDAIKPIIREYEINDIEKLYRIINSYLLAAHDIINKPDFDSAIAKPTVFKILMSHLKTVIALIAETNHEEMDTISGHKKYLNRSLNGMVEEIYTAKAYAKVVEKMNKNLLKKTISI
jgi:DGQHR domain-containing protein